ncbi:MAG TPA: substrate-binding domain-containing protein, partial [Pseudomonadales bacterium]|nr:substrate-binding domain-containing protein [Pseudomonadales bacterium]
MHLSGRTFARLFRFTLIAALSVASTSVRANAGENNQTPPSLRCAGANTMQELVTRWADGLKTAQPGIKVEIDRKTSLSADGFVAMLAGKVNCVTFAREMFPAEIAAYKARFGRMPLMFPVATGSRATLHATHAIAIYVNAENPLHHLTMAQLTEIFSATRPEGGPGKPLTWGELGVTGRWARRPVHVYGMTPWRATGNPPGIVNFLAGKLLHDRKFRDDLRVQKTEPGVPALKGIVDRIAADADGIGYSGFGFAETDIKTIALGDNTGGPFYSGTLQQVAQRRYPLTRTIYLAFPPDANGRVSFAARQFLHHALSTQGQLLVEAGIEHFLPLTTRLAKHVRSMIDTPAQPVTAYSTRQLTAYVPRPIDIPHNAEYRRNDGSIGVVGYNDMRGMLAALNNLFMAQHPEISFDLDLRGTRTAPPALANGQSAFAPMGAPFEAQALAQYRKLNGDDPLAVRVAHAALDACARSSPLGLYVSRDNPLHSLDLDQATRIFSGELKTWGQLGLTGAWHNRPIHTYGLAPSTALGTYFMHRIKLNRLSAGGHVDFHQSREVIEAMAS